MKNTFGSALALTIFGESHGRAIGGVLDGMAAGVPVDEAFIAACMDRRRARGDGLSTPRVEADRVQLLSGVVNGHTTGTAIALMIENQNTRSGDYAKTADLLRPGHADYTAYAKYHGFQDARGGGHFSGRITAALVAGGAIVLDTLYLQDLQPSQSLTYSVTAPEGTTLAENVGPVTVTIVVTGVTERNVTVTAFNCENVPEGFSAVPVTESLNILLRGLESEMAQITAEDLRITVDLSGITEPGVHTVPVTVQVANYANVGVKGSYQIVVDVERLP